MGFFGSMWINSLWRSLICNTHFEPLRIYTRHEDPHLQTERWVISGYIVLIVRSMKPKVLKTINWGKINIEISRQTQLRTYAEKDEVSSEWIDL